MPEEQKYDLELELERYCGKRTAEHTIKKQLEQLASRGFGGGRGRKWQYEVFLDSVQPIGDLKDAMERIEREEISAVRDTGARYLFKGRILGRREDGKPPSDLNLVQIIRYVEKTGSGGPFSKYPWRIVAGGDVAKGAIATDREDKLASYAEIGTKLGHHFDHLYGLNSHIQIIHSAITAAVRSEFNNRFHCVLHGPPGCGKTHVLESFGNMLGTREVNYMVFDATSTTAAGAIQFLMEAEMIPPVLIVEEIEKAEEKSQRWLLGLMDQRAIIQRVNARVGHQARNVKMLVLATVNDMGLFKSAMSGALASRFCHEIFFQRPTEEIVRKILKREIEKVNGKLEWIEPTIKYCMHKRNITDPRKIVPICLSGGDDLINGKYQKYLDATRPKSETK